MSRSIDGHRITDTLDVDPLAETFLGVVAEEGKERPCCLRLLRAEVEAEGPAAARFLEEVSALRELRSEHLAAVLGGGLFEGRPYVASASLEGLDLGRLEVPLPLAQAFQVGEDLAQGLARLHEAGHTHGCLRPSAVRLDPRGRARLADLGTAGFTGRLHAELPKLLRQSASFLSPEHMSKAGPRPASDLFSLGSVLFWLLTGVPPFEGSTPLAVTIRIASGRRLSLSELAPELPEDARELVLSLLHPRPEPRPDAAATLASLRALRERSPSDRVGLAERVAAHLRARDPFEDEETELVPARQLATALGRLKRAQSEPHLAAPHLAEPHLAAPHLAEPSVEDLSITDSRSLDSETRTLLHDIGDLEEPEEESAEEESAEEESAEEEAHTSLVSLPSFEEVTSPLRCPPTAPGEPPEAEEEHALTDPLVRPPAESGPPSEARTRLMRAGESLLPSRPPKKEPEVLPLPVLIAIGGGGVLLLLTFLGVIVLLSR